MKKDMNVQKVKVMIMMLIMCDIIHGMSNVLLHHLVPREETMHHEHDHHGGKHYCVVPVHQLQADIYIMGYLKHWKNLY